MVLFPGTGYKWVLQRELEDPQSARHSEVGGVAPSARVGYMNGLLRATAPELERMRDALLQKEEQLAVCRNTISELEATRDRQVLKRVEGEFPRPYLVMP